MCNTVTVAAPVEPVEVPAKPPWDIGNGVCMPHIASHHTAHAVSDPLVPEILDFIVCGYNLFILI